MCTVLVCSPFGGASFSTRPSCPRCMSIPPFWSGRNDAAKLPAGCRALTLQVPSHFSVQKPPSRRYLPLYLGSPGVGSVASRLRGVQIVFLHQPKIQQPSHSPDQNSANVPAGCHAERPKKSERHVPAYLLAPRRVNPPTSTSLTPLYSASLHFKHADIENSADTCDPASCIAFD